MDVPDKRMITPWAGWSGLCEGSSDCAEWHATYSLRSVSFWSFPFNISDHGWSRVTETEESETVDKGNYYSYLPQSQKALPNLSSAYFPDIVSQCSPAYSFPTLCYAFPLLSVWRTPTHHWSLNSNSSGQYYRISFFLVSPMTPLFFLKHSSCFPLFDFMSLLHRRQGPYLVLEPNLCLVIESVVFSWNRI